MSDPEEAQSRNLVLSVDGVWKQFRARSSRRRWGLLGSFGGGRKFWALEDVSLEARRGEIIGVIGMNGSGKSTLLKIIAGISPASKGGVKVDGRVGSLIELGAGFHPELSGYDNVYLNAGILGLSRPQIDDILPKVIAYAELEGLMSMPVKHFSSGMFVRLGFAIAIQTKPDLLLLDETLAVGDLAFQARTVQSIQDFKRRGCAIIMVSHNIHAIREYCDRAIWLHQGRVRMLDDARTTTQAYLDFIGSLSDRKSEWRHATHANELLPGEPVADSPVEITDLRVRRETALASPSSALADFPEQLRIEVDYRCHRALDSVRLCLLARRPLDNWLILEKDSMRDSELRGLRQGEGRVVLTIDTSRFFAMDLEIRAVFLDPSDSSRKWAERRLSFHLDGLPQPEAEVMKYVQSPGLEYVHSPGPEA
jgi:ABC-type polysaccharide/polyol phosphate transport system ATPase subunit